MVAAILPASRSVQVPPTAFGILLNLNPSLAAFCHVSPATNLPGTSFVF